MSHICREPFSFKYSDIHRQALGIWCGYLLGAISHLSFQPASGCAPQINLSSKWSHGHVASAPDLLVWGSCLLPQPCPSLSVSHLKWTPLNYLWFAVSFSFCCFPTSRSFCVRPRLFSRSVRFPFAYLTVDSEFCTDTQLFREALQATMSGSGAIRL